MAMKICQWSFSLNMIILYLESYTNQTYCKLLKKYPDKKYGFSSKIYHLLEVNLITKWIKMNKSIKDLNLVNSSV